MYLSQPIRRNRSICYSMSARVVASSLGAFSAPLTRYALESCLTNPLMKEMGYGFNHVAPPYGWFAS
jgi:hypothetical protein